MKLRRRQDREMENSRRLPKLVEKPFMATIGQAVRQAPREEEKSRAEAKANERRAAIFESSA